MSLCPSSFTSFPVCPMVVHLDRGEHLTAQNPRRSLSSDEVTEFSLSPVSRGEISRLPRHSAENLYKDEEICNNITSAFIASIFSSVIASIFNCHRTSPFRESILNHLQYATPHHHSRSYSFRSSKREVQEGACGSTPETCTPVMPDVLSLDDGQKYNIVDMDYGLVEELAGLAQNGSVAADIPEAFKAFEIAA